jgi:hypothetical protein
MGKYGETAVRAVELLHGSQRTAEDAWRQAAAEIFPDAHEARRKTCPREAFLGLCRRGLVRGIQPDRCTPSDAGKNRAYAASAVEMIAREPSLANESRTELWRRVMQDVGADPEKKHNQQLDVVLALYSKGLLASP